MWEPRKAIESVILVFIIETFYHGAAVEATSCMYPGSRINSKTNLDPRQTEYVEGSVAEYSCDEGFTLIGQKTRVCQEPGKWSGVQPFCGLELPLYPTRIASTGIQSELNAIDRQFNSCSVLYPPKYSNQSYSWTLDLDVIYHIRMLRLYTTELIADGKELRVSASSTQKGLETAEGKRAKFPPAEPHLGRHSRYVYNILLPEGLIGRFIKIDILGTSKDEVYEICELFTVIEHGTPENFCENKEFSEAGTYGYEIGNQCYQFTNTRAASYKNAKAYCNKKRAVLPTNIDDGLLNRLRSQVHAHVLTHNNQISEIWIGAKRREGTWRWSNGEEIDTYLLSPYEEQTEPENMSCLVLHDANHWFAKITECRNLQPPYPYIICQHNRTQCGQPVQNEMSSLTMKPEDKIGRLAQFTCPEGYESKGAQALQCGHDGLWNKPSPQCIKETEPETQKGSGVVAGILAAVFLGAIVIALCVFFVKRHMARRRKESISGNVKKLSTRRLDTEHDAYTEPCLTKQEVIEEEEVKPSSSELYNAEVPDVVQMEPRVPLRKSIYDSRSRDSNSSEEEKKQRALRKSRRSVRFSDQIDVRKRSDDMGQPLLPGQHKQNPKISPRQNPPERIAEETRQAVGQKSPRQSPQVSPRKDSPEGPEPSSDVVPNSQAKTGKVQPKSSGQNSYNEKFQSQDQPVANALQQSTRPSEDTSKEPNQQETVTMKTSEQDLDTDAGTEKKASDDLLSRELTSGQNVGC